MVKPGGLVMFQALARSISQRGTRFESPVDTPDGTVTIDMNVFPRSGVEDTIRGAGGYLVQAFADVSAGDRFESIFYICTR